MSRGRIAVQLADRATAFEVQLLLIGAFLLLVVVWVLKIEPYLAARTGPDGTAARGESE